MADDAITPAHAPGDSSRWFGDTPVFLVIRLPNGQGIGIDLDEPGWTTKFHDAMRTEALWELFDKTGRVKLRMMVRPGEQPYYTARHVGMAGSTGSNEITAYGIGKKMPIYGKSRRDGKPRIARWQTVRLWLMPDGSVVGGDDESPIGLMFVQALGPKPYHPEEEPPG